MMNILKLINYPSQYKSSRIQVEAILLTHYIKIKLVNKINSK